MPKPTRFVQPFKNYEILDRLGSGGMGTVFRAKRKTDGKIVALKVLRPSLSRNRRYVERLKREAEISIRLTHPALVKGLEFGEEQGYQFLAMEFVDAKSLKELLQNWGRFPLEQVLDVGRQCAEALQCIHGQGVVHRDIKPGNILIDDEGHVWLTDLGLAKGGEDPSLTRDGATIGTPQYMSPEQARDPASVDERSDLYSLGATLYHMATGQPPFQAETVGKLIHAVLHERIPPASSLNPALDRGLDLVLRKLLMREPGRRYASAEELLRDLEQVAAGKAPKVNLRAIEKAERPPTFVSRHRVALLITTLTIAGWLVLWSLWPEPKAGKEEKIVGIPHLEKVLARIRKPRRRLAILETFEPRNRDEREAFVLLREREYQGLDARILDFFRKRLGVRAFEEWLGRNRLARWKPAYLPHFVEDAFFREFQLLPRDLPGSPGVEGEGRGGPREHFRIWMGREEDLIRREVGRIVTRTVRHLGERFETFGAARLQEMEKNKEWGKLVGQLEFWDRHPERLDPEVETILPLPPGFEGALSPFHTMVASEIEGARKRARLQVLSWMTQARSLRERVETLLDLGQGTQAFHLLEIYGAFVRRHEDAWRDLPKDFEDPAGPEERAVIQLEARIRDLLFRQEQPVFDSLLDGILHFCREGKDFQGPEQLLLQTHFLSEPLLERARTLAEDLLLARETGESLLDSLLREGRRQTFLLVDPPEAYSGTPFERDNLVLHCKDRRGRIRSIPLGRMETRFLLGRVGEGDILHGVQKDEELGLLLFFLGRDEEALKWIGRSKRDPAPFLKLSRRRRVFEETRRLRKKRRWNGWLEAAQQSLEQGRLDQASSLLKLLPQVFPSLLQDKESARTLQVLKAGWERKQHLLNLGDRLGPPLRGFSTVRALAGGRLRLSVDFFSSDRKSADPRAWVLNPLGLESPSPESLGEERPGSPLSLGIPFLDPKQALSVRLQLRIPRGRGLAGFRLDLGGTRFFFAQAPGNSGRFGRLRPGEGLVDGLRYAAGEAREKARAPWFLVPGLSYSVEIRRVPAPNRKWDLQVFLDGTRLGRFFTTVHEKALEVRVQAAGGLVLSHLVFEGKEFAR